MWAAAVPYDTKLFGDKGRTNRGWRVDRTAIGASTRAAKPHGKVLLFEQGEYVAKQILYATQ